MGDSPGNRFRAAMRVETPLQVVGTINALTAKLAQRVGFRALYLSGAGVANASLGLPDLGMTSLTDVAEDARRLTSATDLPLLVDCDTGWANTGGIANTVTTMHRIGVAAIHLEDQIDDKRCGHRAGKQLVTTSQMLDRLKAALDARPDESMLIVARCDAVAVEGVEAALQRCQRYAEVGADMIFAEALTEASQYSRFADQLPIPILANMTEFGQSPLLDTDQLSAAGVAVALYPLTAFRAMNAAAELVLRCLRHEGTQLPVLDQLQTRQRLYELLDYERYEQQLDQRLSEPSSNLVEPER